MRTVLIVMTCVRLNVYWGKLWQLIQVNRFGKMMKSVRPSVESMIAAM